MNTHKLETLTPAVNVVNKDNHDKKDALINHLLTTNNFIATKSEINNLINQLKIFPQYPIILVGGTNGKGSTCAYLTTILSIAGYKVGTFTSPHVFDYNERIKINNIAVDDSTLSEALQTIIAANPINLGLFKTFALTSHLIFAAHNIDIAIVEVGIGGTKDITNMFEPEISAITCVDLDHCDILGDTLEEIGLEKAGIYRTHKPAFYGALNPPLSLIDYAQSIKTELNLFNKDFHFKKDEYSWSFTSEDLKLYSLPFPSMRGSEQLANASLALAILGKLKNKFPVNIAQIKNGLLQTSLIGRFQVMPGMPQIIFDTAHNPQAIETMCNNMIKLHFAKRNFAVFSIANDKNWHEIIIKHAKKFDYWFLAPLANNKSAPVSDIRNLLLANEIKEEYIITAEDTEESFRLAYNKLHNEDRLVCFGSFLTVESGYKTLQAIRK